MADENPQESRPVGAPRLDRAGRSLDPPKQEKTREEAQSKEISREISALFAVAEAGRRSATASELLARLSSIPDVNDVASSLERAKALLWGALDLLDFEGDDDDE